MNVSVLYPMTYNVVTKPIIIISVIVPKFSYMYEAYPLPHPHTHPPTHTHPHTQMIIQRMDGGRGCDKLPVAHTCFNVLDLPPYDRKLIMKQKLLQAINFTSGFGLI